MPKVLTIIQTPVFGGPHNQVVNLVEPLAAEGWESMVVLPTESDTGVERLRAANIPFVQTPLHRLRAKLNPMTHIALATSFMPEVRQLEKLIRQFQADVVHICGLMSMHGGVAAKRQDVPIMWQLLSNFAKPPLRQILTHYVAQNADSVMTTGRKIAEMHSEILKLGDRVIHFVAPVDTNRFRPDPQKRSAARKELGIPDDGLLIGTVGNRNRQKAHERMIEAFGYLQKQYSNVHFRILGANTPSYAPTYQKLVIERAKKLGLLDQGRLQFVEPGSRVVDLLPAFDIFVLTSRAEGIPTAILEAMSCAIPVVAMDVGAVEEVVLDGKTGILVRSTNPTIFAHAVAQLIEDPLRREEMGHNSRDYAVAEFGIAQCVRLHSLAYQKAIEHHQQRAAS
jgi:glycosyltransferase involved in cell wall biosynthesis